jgi:branched-chain amino acid transport system permease protein
MLPLTPTLSPYVQKRYGERGNHRLMSLSFLFVQFLNGLASSASLFIIASGLTIVFGVTRIVNFAHGSLYMLGAYFAVTILPRLLAISATLPMFVVGVICAAVLTGLIGVLIEALLLRRIYRAPELLQLLATFAVVLIIQDLVIKVWGPLEILGPRAPGLTGAIEILGQKFPTYELFLIVMGPLVLLGLHLLLTKTRFGILIRAATQDREMVAALGVNQARLFTATLFLGATLAGLGGALQTPKASATSQMDISILTEAFAVTVIGGMGSVPGAAIAALIIGQLQAFGILAFPKITIVLVFLFMAAVLIVRPTGLLGQPETGNTRVVLPEGLLQLRPLSKEGRYAVIGFAIPLVLAPLVVDSYTLKLMIESAVFSVGAAALAFLISNAGLVSFGHAATFGLGAYAAGLAVKKLGLGMALALVAAPVVAGLAALLFAAFLVRLSGIYLAMLTLAFAQIVYAAAFQWDTLTGGDNGLVGIWPSAWASSRIVYYYLALSLCVATLMALYRITHAPLGYALRASRDSQLRAEAIGISVAATRLAAFAIAGAASGLAGGLYAFSKGSIDPTLLAIPMSVDFLVMILMGGIEHIAGAIVGAIGFHSLKDYVMPLTDMWRMLLGALIIAIILVCPQGLAGTASNLYRKRAS